MDDTRTRLIAAAGQVFADRGFDAAGIRDICHVARANVASVKYYFGDKRGLYIAVLEQVHERSASIEQILDEAGPVSAAERLKIFIREIVRDCLRLDRPAWHMEVMFRELANRTEAGEAVTETFIRPKSKALHSILQDLLGEHCNRVQVWRLEFSILGQIVLYSSHRSILQQLSGVSNEVLLNHDELAEHIYRFSLNGVNAYLKEPDLK